jgi:hypothetical protein
MLKRILSYMTGALALSIGLALAADPPPAKEQVHGSQVMTQQERDAHRAKINAAKTAQEKEKVRAEEHARLKERAEQQGKAMPEKPPAKGDGTGPGRAGWMVPGTGSEPKR